MKQSRAPRASAICFEQDERMTNELLCAVASCAFFLRHRKYAAGERVSKTALGRGLDKLMTEGTQVPPTENSASNPPKRSAGVGVLLRGANGFEEKQNAAEPAQTAPRRRPIPEKRLIQAALVGGDVLLLGLAARLAWKASGPMGTGDLLLCLIALFVGAALTCLAFWLE
jgi:hypothetical protein